MNRATVFLTVYHHQHTSTFSDKAQCSGYQNKNTSDQAVAAEAECRARSLLTLPTEEVNWCVLTGGGVMIMIVMMICSAVSECQRYCLEW